MKKLKVTFIKVFVWSLRDMFYLLLLQFNIWNENFPYSEILDFSIREEE